jgi:ligand-binding sensor domain-containing protein
MKIAGEGFWAGGEALWRLNPNSGPNTPIVTPVYTMKNGLPGNRIEAFLETTDGRFWVATAGGWGGYVAGADRFEGYTVANGLSDPGLKSLAEDRDGNLWVGTKAAGIMRIARQGFTSYTQSDGLTGTRIKSLFADRAGDLFAKTSAAITGRGASWSLDCFDGKRFQAIRPRYPQRIRYFGWGWNQTVLQDHTGEWWIPTGQGLCRFGRAEHAEQLAGRAPKVVYTTEDGLPDNDMFRLFEDSQGDIWLSTAGKPHNPLTKWERATGRFRVYSEADGLPRIQASATAFAEDRFGQVWIGLYDGNLVRFQNGHFTVYFESDGAPAGRIDSLYLDRAGRLWIGARGGGLARIDNHGEARPRFTAYTTAQGLSSDIVHSIVEDEGGRIYAGTARGVDRLDPTTGRTKHYTTAHGLARGELQVGRDRQGGLWFGSVLGLARLIPEADRPTSPPPILITGLQIQGVSKPLAGLGQTRVTGLMLRPNQNQARFEFLGLGFGPGELLRYQYRLEGSDPEWSSPSEQRSVNYASLRPGSYRFRVRAINAEGASSPQEATVAF